MSIFLNDILELEELENTKLRFVKESRPSDDLIVMYKENRNELLRWQFWNYSKHRSFSLGQIAIGFVRIEGNKWLLFDISRITKDLQKFNDVGYEYETLEKYEKYFGRVIIEYQNRSQQMVRRAKSVINDCRVLQILEDAFDNDIFPGYENVSLSWNDLRRVLTKSVWKTALENQKGVYLITNRSNGKKYVGSAYGDKMLYGRWAAYVECGHGGNAELRSLDFDHIRENFHFSILDIYKSTIEDKVIINRETWWKNTLMTRKPFGYNKN